MSGIESKIEKLNANNYSNWSLVLTSLLKSKGIWKYIDEQPDYEKEEQMMKSEEGKSIMYAAMDPQQIISTGTCATSRDLWVKIKENHEGAQKDLMNNALASFLGFKYKPGETLIQYCGRFEVALARVVNTGKEVDETTKIWVFKNSLSANLKEKIAYWSMANEDGKCSELISQLKIQYHSDKGCNEEQPSVALFSGEKKSWSSSQQRNNGAFKKPNNTDSQNGFRSAGPAKDNPNYKAVICRYCKNPGHIWQDCRKRKDDEHRKKSFATKGNNNRHINKGANGAFKASEEEPPQRCINFSKYKWIVDSGASSHMTPEKSFLTDYSEFSEPKRIAMGTGKIAMAYGDGTLHFRSGKFIGKLLSVMWVPDLQENLFSLGRTLALGYDVNFDPVSKQVRFVHEGTLRLIGYSAGKNLFTVKLKPTKARDSGEESALLGASLEDWHKRFAHASTDSIKQLIRSGAVKGLNIDNNVKQKCIHCALGKICRCSHPSRKKMKADENSAVLHIDTCGPIDTPSLGGSKYFVLATEEYSGYRLISFVSSKSDIPSQVKTLINQVELESGRTVKMITTDNGSEYVNHSLTGWLAEKGVIHDLSAPYTPEQNGRAERANRTIIEGTRTLLSQSKLPLSLWAEAAGTVVYVSNRMLHGQHDNKTKYELYFKAVPDVSNLRQFGQQAIVRLPNSKRGSKWEEKGVQLTFVGYTSRQNTFRFYDMESDELYISCDAIFLDPSVPGRNKEDKEDGVKLILTPSQSVQPSNPDTSNDETMILDNEEQQVQNDSPHINECSDEPNIQPEGDQVLDNGEISVYLPSEESSATESLSTSQTDSNSTSSIANSIFNLPSSPLGRVTRAAARALNIPYLSNSHLPANHPFWKRQEQDDDGAALITFTLNDEPMSLKDAMESSLWPKWKIAMDEELAALMKNNTWELVDPPHGVKPIKCKWVFKIKLDPNGEVDRYKARLVAKGYSQIPDVDYKETFAPTASMNTIRALFGIANQQDMEILQFDVKTAFLYGDLNETLYMEHPEGYPNPQNKVCRLVKSLYGLKQAPRQWNRKFDNFLKEFKLEQSVVDKCLYYNRDRTLLLVIYVDDGLVASTDSKLLKDLVAYLQKHLDLKTMQCEAYLGFKVTRDRLKRTLFLQQSHYIDKVLERYNMSDCKPASTPEEVGNTIDDKAELLTPDYPFKELIGSLNYLVTCTRPDIAHAVSVASRTSQPTMQHWQQLKRILRYLKGSRDLGIQFRWEDNPKLVGYSDADYANDVKTRRSTTGYCIMYGNTPIAWRCQRQPIVSLSTTEAEYISGCELVKELIPLRELMMEIGQIENEPTTVLIDNQSTVKIARDEGGQQRTKHIDVREKWLSEQHVQGKIKVEHIRGDEQAADILTKPLHKTKFQLNRKLLVSGLALISLVTAVSCHTFARIDPLYFRPSEVQYFNGDTEFRLKFIVVNPCKSYFEDIFSSPKMGKVLFRQCNSSFYGTVMPSLKHCIKSTGDPFENSAVTRPKRFVPAFLAITGIVALIGVAAHASIKAEINRLNIETIASMQEKEKDLLFEGGNIFRHIRDNLHGIKVWSGEVESIISEFREYNAITPKLAELVTKYLNDFREQRDILKELDRSVEVRRVPARLRDLSNVTLWEEPASEWSHLYNCSQYLEGDNLVINLRFNMPHRDKQMQVMDAVPLNFYNQTVNYEGHSSLCWMYYKGPRKVLVNTTTNCMAELINWEQEETLVHSQTCKKGEDEELKPSDSLWAQGECSKNPIPTKAHIQDKEINGLHRIYCYPYNITLENETFPCPDYPFELESKNTYKIANLEHHGFYVERTVMKSADLHISKEIASALRMDTIKISKINLTALNSSYDSYFQKLQNLPQNVTLKKAPDFFSTEWLKPILEGPLAWVNSIQQKFWKYIQAAGIVFGVVAAGMVLMMLAPIIELFIFLIGIVRYIGGLWVNSLKNLGTKVNVKKKRKRNYWDEESMKLI